MKEGNEYRGMPTYFGISICSLQVKLSDDFADTFLDSQSGLYHKGESIIHGADGDVEGLGYLGTEGDHTYSMYITRYQRVFICIILI